MCNYWMGRDGVRLELQFEMRVGHPQFIRKMLFFRLTEQFTVLSSTELALTLYFVDGMFIAGEQAGRLASQ